IGQHDWSFPSQETRGLRICKPNFGVRHSDKQFRDRRDFRMHNEPIAFERASRHSYAIKPGVRKFNSHNLRFESWEWRKADCLELNFFPTQEPFPQITQCQGEPESSESA